MNTTDRTAERITNLRSDLDNRVYGTIATISDMESVAGTCFSKGRHPEGSNLLITFGRLLEARVASRKEILLSSLVQHLDAAERVLA
jgi:hypothetical protein